MQMGACMVVSISDLCHCLPCQQQESCAVCLPNQVNPTSPIPAPDQGQARQKKGSQQNYPIWNWASSQVRMRRLAQQIVGEGLGLKEAAASAHRDMKLRRQEDRAAA